MEIYINISYSSSVSWPELKIGVCGQMAVNLYKNVINYFN